MALSAKAEIRQQLNLKNLQRHDPRIERIVTSTSHASLYDNKGDGWIKTGVEGPMFLFARSTAPNYGFFVLNRNGLEYVQEFLTPQCEVEVGGEFILYERGADAAGYPKGLELTNHEPKDCATGIWVSEEKERVELSQQMRLLRSKAAAAAEASAHNPTAAPGPALPVGQSISLDMLFSAASPTSLHATAPHPSSSSAGPTNPLDALFAKATISPSPARATLPSSAHKLPAQLEQLFAAASPTPAAAVLPQARSPQGQPTGMALLDSIFASAKSPQLTPAQPPAPPPQPPKPNDARALLAMLGHPMSPPAPVSASAPAPAPAPEPRANGTAQPAPHPSTTTTMHPAPFALDVAPTSAPAPALAVDEPKQDELKKEDKPKPVFARPVLSHDVFDSLPLPGKRAPAPAPAAPEPERLDKVELPVPTPAPVTETQPEKVSEHTPEPPVEPAPAPVAALSPSPSASSSSPPLTRQPAPTAAVQQPLLFEKPALLAFADGAAATARVGMEDGREAPMEKDEFVRRVMALLQKPSLSMQLYGKYLERFEEAE